MLEKLKSFVENIAKVEPFDAARFNDPLALQTTWTPAKSGGSNFHTHRLVEVDNHRLEFRATWGAKLFAAVFIAVGVGVVLIEVLFGFVDSNTGEAANPLFIYLFGLLFATAGGCMYYFMSTPRVFDKWAGLYWKGHKQPKGIHDISTKKNSSRISDIHAIQLLSEYVRGDKSSYHSYEINLVLKNGERINVVDHGKLTEVRNDARKLSEFLGKPIWDAT
ncbi:MAG: hypothetical protein EA390_09270 [Balneolaceae bacterium]|nr:MAG: hypothetical protein EA390_09270 [Balneolaceae bacterium]